MYPLCGQQWTGTGTWNRRRIRNWRHLCETGVFFHSWNCFRWCEPEYGYLTYTDWIGVWITVWTSMRVTRSFFPHMFQEDRKYGKGRHCHNMMYWKDVLFLNEKGFEIIWIFHRWKTLKTWYFPRILCFQITYYPHSLHICLKTVFHNCWKLLIISKSLYFIDIFTCW